MKRFLIIFVSSPAPETDLTVIDVHEDTALRAIRRAKRETFIAHPWVRVRALEWPIGVRDVDHAIEHIENATLSA